MIEQKAIIIKDENWVDRIWEDATESVGVSTILVLILVGFCLWLLKRD